MVLVGQIDAMKRQPRQARANNGAIAGANAAASKPQSQTGPQPRLVSTKHPAPDFSLRTRNHAPTGRGLLLRAGLIISLAVALLGAALALRSNNLHMVTLRDDLVAADRTGDATKVRTAARKLQNYMAHHMNTTTGRVALQTLYNQAAQKAMEASKPVEISTDVYQAATEACKPQLTNYGYRAWANCVSGKVGSGGVTSLDINKQPAPDPDVYYVEYAPARFSFDLAGWLIILSLMLAIVLIVIAALDLCRLVIKKLKQN